MSKTAKDSPAVVAPLTHNITGLSQLQIEPNRGHSLVKFFTQAEWAIMPEKLDQLELVLNQFIAGTNVNMSSGFNRDCEIINDIAVIPIIGTIVKRAYGLDSISGVRTTLDIQKNIQEAIDNPAVSGIVLSTDSPGGTVDGTKELADFVKEAVEIKPIVGYVDGLMASAAYWIGSACTKIVCYDTAKVGSVGVVVKHQEQAKFEERIGVKTTFIYKGEYKTAGNIHEPLSDKNKSYIQAHVDEYYSMFVDAVATNRGIETSVVISDIAIGAVFTANDALKLNLIDSIGNLDAAISAAQQIGEDKMAKEKTEATLETLTAQMATLATNMETVQAALVTSEQANETLTSQLADQVQVIADRDEADASAKTLAEVTTLFADCQVEPAFVESIVSLDEDVRAGIHAEISGRQTRLDAFLVEFGETTSGTTTEQGNVDTPETIDAAITMIETRDGIDVEEAGEKAQIEFPKLFENADR